MRSELGFMGYHLNTITTKDVLKEVSETVMTEG
jgi:hypothetical protein